MRQEQGDEEGTQTLIAPLRLTLHLLHSETNQLGKCTDAAKHMKSALGKTKAKRYTKHRVRQAAGPVSTVTKVAPNRHVVTSAYSLVQMSTVCF